MICFAEHEIVGDGVSVAGTMHDPIVIDDD